jgi:hypothetical protein
MRESKLIKVSPCRPTCFWTYRSSAATLRCNTQPRRQEPDRSDNDEGFNQAGQAFAIENDNESTRRSNAGGKN